MLDRVSSKLRRRIRKGLVARVLYSSCCHRLQLSGPLYQEQSDCARRTQRQYFTYTQFPMSHSLSR